MSPYRRWVGLFLFGSVLPSTALAYQTPDRTARRVTAAERTGDVRLDGRLDEAAWAGAPVATDFIQRSPVEGDAAQERTEVRILYDGQALYVGARLYDREPSTIGRQLVRRDEWGQYDYFEVAFDPNLDRRTGYQFNVSAANQQRDDYLFDDSDEDGAWDAVWESAVHIDSAGWSVEMRIPLSQFQYEASDAVQSWGVNFTRRRVQSNEFSQFALVSQLQQGVVSQFGVLDGLRFARPSRRLEARPYVLSSAFAGQPDPGDPFASNPDLAARAGVDLRVGLGSQFTLNATVNPDFGQVEADPAVINLTAFETFFQERRPFFVEDAQIFNYSLSGGRNRLFYSRRIGRDPHGSPPGGATYSDIPDAATILGALKVTGRTTSGLSLGALAAVTQRERGRAFFAETDSTGTFVVEPRSGYGVLRLRQDFNDGASTVGALSTLLVRDLPEDGSFDFLPRVAVAAGVDWELQWADRGWAFFGYAAGTHVRGDSTALIRIQRSSTHYFQRPDSRWLSLDSSATSMTGIDWRMTLEKRRGRHWTGSVWAAQVTPGFEVNDLGFSSRQEVLDGGMRIRYREIEPGRVFRNYDVTFFTFHNWTHDALKDIGSSRAWQRAHVRGSFNLRGSVEFLNYWGVNAAVSIRPAMMDRTATRGGPLMASPRSYRVDLSAETDDRNKLSLEPGIEYEVGEQGSGTRFSANVQVSYRPVSQVEIEVEPEWTSQTNASQYVRTSTAVPFSPTFGPRYLFADLRRRELALQTRLNITFTPRLSLQLYAQPLVSSGDYVAYKQFLKPETFSFWTLPEGEHQSLNGADTCVGGLTCIDTEGRRYVDFDGDGAVDDDFGDRDFNVRSLIGNVVLRWEYRPGSTIFVVWQRRQRDRVGIGDFSFGRDVAALLTAPAENLFMVKVNYWFGL
jgi:hypothetical protein